MAHFAELDNNGIVVRVVVVANEILQQNGFESEDLGIDFLEGLYGHRDWKQTSYNRTFRGHFASSGYYYDQTQDCFTPPTAAFPDF